ncbi:DinB family protein [Paenibacillus sp. GCM10027626]|uniref:DinB family protein n=1 Tax=Paenibacillus sp. GCM10027626 TaxID=3273411 RepID=UPI003627C236
MEREKSENLLKSFRSYIPFLETLRAVPAIHWVRPMEQDKWSPGEVIAHILLWDRYFLESAIQNIATNEPVTAKHLDFDAFNAQAAPYAASVSQQALIDEAISCREEIIRLISRVPTGEFELAHTDGDGNPFTIIGYLEGFVPHDLHHRRQIETYLDKL